MFSEKELADQIRAMGILPTDTVIIHRSLRAVGATENGADGLINAFTQVLTKGLLLIPTHTWAVVGQHQPMYDVRTTVPNIGVLPRVAAFRPDGIRSLHPTHSVAAFGKHAAEYIAGEEKAGSPAPPGGVMHRLASVDAKILLVGVGHDCNTFIHSLDEESQIPDRLYPESYEITILDHAGNEYTTQFRHHRCSKHPDVSENYPNFESALIATGAQHTGKLGNADVRIVDAAKCRDTVLRILSRADQDPEIQPLEIPESWYLP